MIRNRKKSRSNKDGLSAFHVACLEHNVEAVRQLLNEKQIDVNRPVDSSGRSHLAGQTPLHLVLNQEFCHGDDDDDACLAIVDLLLKNGAQVNAADSYGETSLHKAVLLGKKNCSILKKILEAGADVNAIKTQGGITGITALDYLLCYGSYSAEHLELFIKHGSRLNAYNPLDEGGYIAVAFVGHGIESEQVKILFNAMHEHPHTIEPDEQGRTVLHSLVAHPGTSLDVEGFVKMIDELGGMAGCDIDDRDKKGRTALYLAAHHGNGDAIEALLIAGADVNITDNDGNLAFDYLKRYSEYAAIAIAMHVRKLELVHLDVSQKNRDFAGSVDLDEAGLREAIQSELELAKSIEVVSPSLRLHHFLYEINSRAAAAIIGNETSIREFFQNFKDERFKQLRSLFKLQYRKAVARSKLTEPAVIALDFVSGCSVLCAELVVRFLRNDDLKRLIESSICDN